MKARTVLQRATRLAHDAINEKIVEHTEGRHNLYTYSRKCGRVAIHRVTSVLLSMDYKYLRQAKRDIIRPVRAQRGSVEASS